MQKDDLLSIGELARTCDVSVKALRFYDETGLITPIYINPENNYRYYSTWQINRILTIKELKKIGFTLETIRECMEHGGMNFDLKKLENVLDTKEKELLNQMEQLRAQQEMIHIYKKYYLYLDKRMQQASKGIHIEDIPSRRFVYQHYEGAHSHEVFRQYFKSTVDLLYKYNQRWYGIPAARFFERFNFSSIKVDIGYLVEEDYLFDEKLMGTLDNGKYAVHIHSGGYTSLVNDGYNKLFDWIRGNNLKVQGPYVECYYINENMSVNENTYVTEIQIPVKEL